MKKFSDYLMVQEAADFLGVTTNTLRNWDGAGKLNAHINPMNGFRLYLKEDLELILKQLYGKIKE